MGNTYGKPIKPEDLLNIKYDETSPTGLRFKSRTHYNQNKDLIVGTYSDSERHRCYNFNINKSGYKCHRVIWYLVKGEDPLGYEIDHIDGNPWNNNITNLRKVPREINVRNAKKRHDNTSGTTGVNLNVAGYGCSYWTASWRVLLSSGETKKQSKHFSINKLGSDEALRLAIQYREQKISELQQDGIYYTERHGQ